MRFEDISDLSLTYEEKNYYSDIANKCSSLNSGVSYVDRENRIAIISTRRGRYEEWPQPQMYAMYWKGWYVNFLYYCVQEIEENCYRYKISLGYINAHFSLKNDINIIISTIKDAIDSIETSNVRKQNRKSVEIEFDLTSVKIGFWGDK